MLTIVWDKEYECKKCEKSLILEKDFSIKDWKCMSCNHPIDIHASDNKHNSYTLIRIPAKHIEIGDFLILGPNLDKNYQVISRIPDKKSTLKIALKGFGVVTTNMEKYFSLITGGWTGTSNH